jgi:prevent-host-death family protein
MMEAFAVRDLREHTGDLIRNAENGQYSVVSKHGKPLFVALPFNDALLTSGVSVALADKMVLQAELSVAAGAKLAGMPYARYLQHLGTLGYSMLDDSADIGAELGTLQKHLASNPKNNRANPKP